MPVIEDDYVVQAFAPDTPDHSLHITVLPRTLRCNPNLLDTYSSEFASDFLFKEWDKMPFRCLL